MISKMNAAWALVPALLASLAFRTAEAATYDLWQSGSPLLSQGASYTAAFDTHLLFDPTTQQIAAATLTLNFVGAEQRVRTGSTSVLTASIGSYNIYDYFDNYVDSADTALILLDGSTFGTKPLPTASSAYYQTDIVRSTRTVGYDQTNCNPFSGCTTRYVEVGTNRYIDHVAGYKGSFSYVAQLDAKQVGLFNADGIFRYGFNVGEGGLQLASAEMVFSTSPVPEPQTVTLTVAGLVLLVARASRASRAHGRSQAGA